MIYSDNIKITSSGIKFSDKHGNNLTLTKAIGKSLNRVLSIINDIELFFIHLVSLHIPLYSIRKIIFKVSGVKIGKGSVIHMGCKFFNPKGIIIGEDTIIGDRAFLDGREDLIIGNHVDIASEVMIYNSEHDVNSSTFEAKNDKVEVGDYVFIGPRVIILPGVKIGKGAVIAAGAVVTKEVKDWEIVGGVPAKTIGERSNKNPQYRLGRARILQ